MNEFQGFWGSVARKAKAVLDDEGSPRRAEAPRAARWHEEKIAIGQQVRKPFVLVMRPSNPFPRW